MNRRVRITAVVSSTIIFPVILFLLIELTLYVAYRITAAESLNYLISNPNELIKYAPYPRSKKCTKIAVFGGSNMRGFTVELSTPVIIQHELRKQPGCFFVKNLADSGAYMNGYGAPLLDALNNYYDTFLIYSGHNEVHALIDLAGLTNVIDESLNKSGQAWQNQIQHLILEHYHPESTQLPHDTELGFQFGFVLARYSRIYGLVTRIKRHPEDYFYRIRNFLPSLGLDVSASTKIEELVLGRTNQEKFYSKSQHVSSQHWPSATESRPIVFGIHEIPQYYQSALSKLDKSKTIISTVSANLFYPPNWSVGLGENAHYFFDQGISDFLGSSTVNWDYFETANKLDGFPIRVLVGVNEAIKSSGLQVVDLDNEIKNRIENQERFSNYFLDIQHLNNVGHILLSRAFLCSMEYEEYCVSLDYDSLRELEKKYIEEIYSPFEFRKLRLKSSIVSFLWNYRMAGFSSCPLCFIRQTSYPASVLLGTEFWRYQRFLSMLSNPDKFDNLGYAETYDFVKYLPDNPMADKVTRAFLVNSFEKLNICSSNGGFVECPTRNTRSYKDWKIW